MTETKPLEKVSKTEEIEQKPETKEEIIKDIKKSGVPEEIAKKEEALDEKASEKKPEEKKEDVKKEEERSRYDRSKSRYERERKEANEISLAAWEPKTKLGEAVKSGKIKNINEILDSGKKILEPEIIDSLIEVKSDLILIGQSKGKFGGGKRRAWRQTQRKTNEGNVPTFSTLAVVGDENGHVGIGSGKAKETLPARDKAIKKAKLNLIHIRRSCSGFDCACDEPHSIPLKTTGKAGSVRVTLIPAAQGTGLVVGKELKKILKLAGIKDVHSRTSGRKRTTFNLVKACIDALQKANIR